MVRLGRLAIILLKTHTPEAPFPWFAREQINQTPVHPTVACDGVGVGPDTTLDRNSNHKVGLISK